MAKTVEKIWDMEKFFWTVYLQVGKEQVKVICKSSSTDKTKLKAYFDLENKQKHSIYAISKCIGKIRNDAMILGDCNSIEFELNGQTIKVKADYGAPSVLKQIAKKDICLSELKVIYYEKAENVIVLLNITFSAFIILYNQPKI